MLCTMNPLPTEAATESAVGGGAGMVMRPLRRAPLYAAIDLGTNNCRLLIARRAGRGLTVIDAFSRIVRLGEGVTMSGALSEAAMSRAVAALCVCATKIRQHAPTALRAVATEACRRANNAPQFIDRVRAVTGLDVELISAEEEAMLALHGCAALLGLDHPQALVFDIGGGSTEIIWLELPWRVPGAPPRVLACLSLPWGVVSLADHFGLLAIGLEGYRDMRAFIDAQLEPFDDQYGIADSVARGAVQMLGSSGTVTTLAGIHLGLERYDRAQVDGIELTRAEVAASIRRVLSMPPVLRARHPCIGRGRADLVIAGCAILDAIMSRWSVPTLRVADRGVREGILLGLMGVPTPVRGPAFIPSAPA